MLFFRSLLVLALCTFLLSCVDDKYDLDKLNPDNTFSPNGISLSLGSVDTIYLKKALDDENIDSLYVDNKGQYYLQYSGDFSVELPSTDNLQFSPEAPVVISTPIPEEAIQGINLLMNNNQWNGQKITVMEDRSIFSIKSEETGQEWNARIDSVDMVCDVTIKVKISNITKLTNSNLIVGITLPPNFVSTQLDSDNHVNFTFGKDSWSSSGEQESVKISKYRFNLPAGLSDQAGEIKYKIQVQGTNASGELATSGNPDVELTIEAKNIDVQVVYGGVAVSEAASGEIDLSSFSKSFTGEENIFDFYNPSIQIRTKSNLGIPFTSTFKMTGMVDGVPQTNHVAEAKDLSLDAPSAIGQHKVNDYWLAVRPEEKPDGSTYKSFNINTVLNAKSDQIKYDLSVKSSKESFSFIDLKNLLSLEAQYTVKVPFAFGPEMSISLSDTVTDVFSEDIIKHVFNTKEEGDVIIAAKAEISLPLSLKVRATVLDENNQIINGINIDDVELGHTNGTTDQDFEIKIKNEYFHLLENARHLKILFLASTYEDMAGSSLSVDDYILLKKLTFKKTGGIHFTVEF